MTETQKTEIIKAIHKIVPQVICPICHANHFILADGYAVSLLQQDLKTYDIGKANVPCAMIVCEKCGYVMQFSLGILGLLNKSSEDVQHSEIRNQKWITDFAQFYQALPNPNYHDIYDMHEVVMGKESPFGFFEIQLINEGKDLLLKYMNAQEVPVLKLPLNKRQEFVSWIEKNLMHGMDAESYYGWEYNMEHDNDKD